MKRRPFSSHLATRVAFGVIIAFVTAQMAWWIYFQTRYVEQVNSSTLAGLEREARTLGALLQEGAVDRVASLLEDQPHLVLTADGGSVVVAEEARDAFLSEQRRIVRMLLFEGPFFVLVVMTGLYIIARNLRLERELKRRQRNFLDAIGHEYRTPISTLRLLVQTMQLRDVPSAKLQEYLRSMSAEVDRLEHTGQQVLATARLEAGEASPALQVHDLGELVRQVVARSDASVAARGGALELRIDDQPVQLRIDPADLATILDNLVDNAIKYTPGPVKPITITVTSQGRWAQLSVEDVGSGIPEPERAHVWGRFYRVGNEMTRTAPGLGLGLYLVSRTAQSLGGEVRLQAGAGGGTLVTVLFPASAAAAPTPSMAVSVEA